MFPFSSRKDTARDKLQISPLETHIKVAPETTQIFMGFDCSKRDYMHGIIIIFTNIEKIFPLFSVIRTKQHWILIETPVPSRISYALQLGSASYLLCMYKIIVLGNIQWSRPLQQLCYPSSHTFVKFYLWLCCYFMLIYVAKQSLLYLAAQSDRVLWLWRFLYILCIPIFAGRLFK